MLSARHELGEAGLSDKRAEFGRLLLSLKNRSGLSYSELGRKTHLSSSTLHRYCTGTTIPSDYRTALAIAEACGATDDDLTELLRCWRTPTEPDEPEAATGPGPAESPAPRRTRGGPLVLTLSALLVALLVLVTTASGPPVAPAKEKQAVSGPAWQRERPVSPTLFGVTASSSSGTMPAFRVGSLRFWDSRTRWASLQPDRGTFDWTVLDRLTGAAQTAGLPATFVLGGTPAWAAPEGPRAPYDDGSRTAPPDDLADWDRFISALVARYRHRIEAYELWAYANDPRYYSGSMETLVAMTRRASEIIRAADPEAILVCPSMGRLWTDQGRTALRRFAELGGYNHCDVAGVKLHQRQASDPPETMIELLDRIDDVFHAAGVHPPLWNTGTTYDLPTEQPLDEHRAIAYGTRFYLVAIYGTDVSLQRTYFYNWGGAGLPITLQVVGGPPTPTALAVEELQRWLTHTTTRACGHGLAINLPKNVWQCEFTTEDHTLLQVRWTDGGTAHTTATASARELRTIDGTSKPLRPGDTVLVTETPELIVHQR